MIRAGRLINRCKTSWNYAFVLAWLPMIFWLTGCQKDGLGLAVANDGFVDLSAWNFEEKGVVSLKENWVISESAGQIHEHPESVSYQLTLKLPDEPESLAIKMVSSLYSFRLKANDHLLIENGIGPKGQFYAVPLHAESSIDFKNDHDILQLTVQVPNSQSNNDVIWNEFNLGTVEQIDNRVIVKLVLEVFLFGAILVMALYHFTLFAFRTDNQSLLFFGVFCILVAIRPMYGNGVLYGFLLSDFPASIVFRLTHIIFYLTILFLALFYVRLFPFHFQSQFLLVVKLLTLLLIPVALVQPIETVLPVSRMYQFISVCYALILSYPHYKVIARKEEGSVIFALGLLIVVIAFTNDALGNAYLIQTFELSSWSVFVFILIQSFLLSKQFSSDFHAVKVLTDELKEKNLALENLDKLKDEFLANTSHELRTPLNGIIGITDSLIKGVAGKLSSAVTSNLSMVVSSAKRLAGLINDIQDYSKLEHKDLVLHKKAVDIRSVAETVITVSRQLITGKELSIVNDIPGNLNCVDGDENRLQQILYNLVGNAVKFTNQGHVTVSAIQRKDWMELSVSDTGPGIPESSYELIFQSFKQYQQAQARTSQGTGLGLSITKKLIKLHNGRIWVESELGRGSTFYFTLPLADKKAVAEKKSDTDSPDEVSHHHPKSAKQGVDQKSEVKTGLTTRQDKVQILVVDDEPVNLQVVANFLALEQISFQLITSGKKLIERLTNGPIPDLVLLDIMMPEMTGYEVCRFLREKYSSSRLPIIMMTAKNRLSDLVEGFDAGANDYLTKPFAKDELLSRIKSQLSIKHAYEALEENLRLKKELQQKEQDQQHLLMIQRKLSDILNTVPDSMIAINEINQISFLNQSFLDLTGYAPDDLLGKPCMAFFQEKGSRSYADLVNDLSGQVPAAEVDKQYHHLMFCAAADKVLTVDVLLTPLEIEDEQLFVLIFRESSKISIDDTSKALLHNSLAIIDELNQNRSRIQTLEESLIGITTKTLENHPELKNDLKNIDQSLNRITTRGVHESPESIPEKVVAAMKLAVGYWIECKGTSKLDLAKCSNLWKIHSDSNGWERARTLDKYLDLKTCPKKPRLEQVINTIYFVLGNCNTQSPQRTQLEEALSGLTNSIT